MEIFDVSFERTRVHHFKENPRKREFNQFIGKISDTMIMSVLIILP